MIVDRLNQLLPIELDASELYLSQSAVAANMGLPRLADRLCNEGAEERGHAKLLMDRILLLGSSPMLTRSVTTEVGSSVPEMLEIGLSLEKTAHAAYQSVLSDALADGDNVTYQMLAGIQKDTEDHIRWLEQQTELIAALTLAGYLQTQV